MKYERNVRKKPHRVHNPAEAEQDLFIFHANCIL
jgi:hypothetical protein